MSKMSGASIDQLTVDSFMSRDVVSVVESDSVHDVLKLMLENQLTAVPVVNFKNRCIGILSKSDLVEWAIDLDEQYERLRDDQAVRIFADEGGKERTVGEFMTDDVITVRVDSTVVEASKKMHSHGIHHLPILGEDGAIVGILSSMDIVGTLATMYGAPAHGVRT